MKTACVVWLSILCGFLPKLCLADSAIELVNGARFVVAEHWQEDGLIKFYRYGGIVGIEKGFVKRISLINPSPAAPAVVEKEPASPQPSVEQEPSATPQKTMAGEKEKPSQPKAEDALLQRRKELKAQINDVLDAFNAAKARKNKRQIRVQRKKFLKLQTELGKLQ